MGRRRRIVRTAAAVLSTAAGLSLLINCTSSGPEDAAGDPGSESVQAEAPEPAPEEPTEPEKAEITDPAALIDVPHSAPPPPKGYSKSAPDFPDLELWDHNGKKVRFFTDLVKGKIVVINFFYATCTGT